jgi:hypothetical protein
MDTFTRKRATTATTTTTDSKGQHYDELNQLAVNGAVLLKLTEGDCDDVRSAFQESVICNHGNIPTHSNGQRKADSLLYKRTSQLMQSIDKRCSEDFNHHRQFVPGEAIYSLGGSKSAMYIDSQLSEKEEFKGVANFSDSANNIYFMYVPGSHDCVLSTSSESCWTDGLRRNFRLSREIVTIPPNHAVIFNTKLLRASQTTHDNLSHVFYKYFGFRHCDGMWKIGDIELYWRLKDRTSPCGPPGETDETAEQYTQEQLDIYFPH